MTTTTVNEIDLRTETDAESWHREALAVASCPSDRARLLRRLADLDALRTVGHNPQRAAWVLL